MSSQTDIACRVIVLNHEGDSRWKKPNAPDIEKNQAVNLLILVEHRPLVHTCVWNFRAVAPPEYDLGWHTGPQDPHIDVHYHMFVTLCRSICGTLCRFICGDPYQEVLRLYPQTLHSHTVVDTLGLLWLSTCLASRAAFTRRHNEVNFPISKSCMRRATIRLLSRRLWTRTLIWVKPRTPCGPPSLWDRRGARRFAGCGNFLSQGPGDEYFLGRLPSPFR